jgi:selenocysteine-specific elongation factor
LYNGHVIIGMAGHIDHGKTALIKALTGVETDRLPEEKQRGITIDIGFAYWKAGITVIDVPGHEKFVRNMVAGVSAVDLFLLVIAADDGIMPQTREHLDILNFFGVHNGVVALNKCDLVEADWLEMVRNDINCYLSQKGFGDIPIAPVSATTHLGIEQLQQTLELKIEQLHKQPADRPFRLNIDRSFSIKGFGRIVTGTILSSEVSVGDEIALLPDGKTGRVRGIEVHQQTVQKATAGQRAALNIVNFPPDALSRGKMIAKPDTLVLCREIFARVKTVDNLNIRIKRNSNFHVHIGAAEVIARVDWFEPDVALKESCSYRLRIKFRDPVAIAPSDAILLRSFSPAATIAGGVVLQTNPPRLKRMRDDWKGYFTVLETSDFTGKISLYFEYLGYKTITPSALQKIWFENPAQIMAVIARLTSQKTILEIDAPAEKHYLYLPKLEEMLPLMVKASEALMQKESYRRGLNRRELENLLRPLAASDIFLDYALKIATERKQLIFNGEIYILPEAYISQKNNSIRDEITAYYHSARFSPPDLSQLAEKFNMDVKTIREFTADLAKKNALRSIDGQFYLHEVIFNELIGFLGIHFTKHEAIDLTLLKEFTGATRKWLIPLLEYLDRKAITRRDGDLRKKGENL